MQGEYFDKHHCSWYVTDVGHRQVTDRLLKIADFISGFWRIDYLHKANNINSIVSAIGTSIESFDV